MLEPQRTYTLDSMVVSLCQEYTFHSEKIEITKFKQQECHLPPTQAIILVYQVPIWKNRQVCLFTQIELVSTNHKLHMLLFLFGLLGMRNSWGAY